MEDELIPHFMLDKVYKTFSAMRGQDHKFQALGDFMCQGKVLTAEEANLAKIACYAFAVNLRKQKDTFVC